jgi:hypothetical protein
MKDNILPIALVAGLVVLLVVINSIEQKKKARKKREDEEMRKRGEAQRQQLLLQEREAYLNKINELYSNGVIFEKSMNELLSFIHSSKFSKQRTESLITSAMLWKQRVENLCDKYGEDVAWKILNNDYWVGMTQEHLIESKGQPTKIETEKLKTKTKEIWIYGNKSSGDYFVFENGVATKVVDR